MGHPAKSRKTAGFKYIAWAREAAPRCANRSDAHVLLVLATYANAEGEAWPSQTTIGRDCGLKVKEDVKGQGACSSIAASLKRLRAAGLIESVHRGNQRASTHRLLAEATSATTEVPTSAHAEENYYNSFNFHAPIASATLIPFLEENKPELALIAEKLLKGLPPTRKSVWEDDDWDAAFERHKGAAA